MLKTFRNLARLVRFVSDSSKLLLFVGISGAQIKFG